MSEKGGGETRRRLIKDKGRIERHPAGERLPPGRLLARQKAGEQKRAGGNPDKTNAVSSAEAPGVAVTGSCSAIAADTSLYPGLQT